MARFVEYYNHQRLHSALRYITPADMLAGRAEAIWAERDRKLEAARERDARYERSKTKVHAAVPEFTNVH